jgi:hypothetical protein
MKLDTFFAKYPVFTVGDIDAFLASEGGENRQTRDALLVYHIEHGRIVRVRRGFTHRLPPAALLSRSRSTPSSSRPA